MDIVQVQQFIPWPLTTCLILESDPMPLIMGLAQLLSQNLPKQSSSAWCVRLTTTSTSRSQSQPCLLSCASPYPRIPCNPWSFSSINHFQASFLPVRQTKSWSCLYITSDLTLVSESWKAPNKNQTTKMRLNLQITTKLGYQITECFMKCKLMCKFSLTCNAYACWRTSLLQMIH